MTILSRVFTVLLALGIGTGLYLGGLSGAWLGAVAAFLVLACLIWALG